MFVVTIAPNDTKEDLARSQALAEWLIGALVRADLADASNVAKAVVIATEEIHVRKVMGDYYAHVEDPIDSVGLAGLVVDALYRQLIVRKELYRNAVLVLTDEIDLCKAQDMY